MQSCLRVSWPTDIPTFVVNTTHGRDLTHDMHNEFGWPEQAEVLADVFEQLTPEERERATIFTGRYGEASALNLHGKAYGLPRATSGHMTHYLWGPDDARMFVLAEADGSERHPGKCIRRRGNQLGLDVLAPVFLLKGILLGVLLLVGRRRERGCSEQREADQA